MTSSTRASGPQWSALIARSKYNGLNKRGRQLIQLIRGNKGVKRIIISEDKKINGKGCYRIGINSGKEWKEPLKNYHIMDMADCFQYYNPTILEYVASRTK